MGEPVEPMIIRVREAIGSESLAAFAERTGLEANKLTKTLSGSRRLTVAELAVVADATGRSVEWLVRGIERATPAMAARRATNATETLEEAAATAGRFTDAYEVIRSLGDAYARKPIVVPDVTSFGRLYKEQGERLADWAWDYLEARNHFNISDLPDMMERVFGVDVAIQPLPSGYDGLSWIQDDFKLALVTRTQVVGRYRFTLAHELGHVLSRDSSDLHVVPAPNSTTQWTPEELRANSFAAAFLMPKKQIQKFLETEDIDTVDDRSFPKLVTQLGVSPQPLLIRLGALGLRSHNLDEKKWRKVSGVDCAAMSGNPNNSVLSIAVQERLPSRLTSEMMGAFNAGDIGVHALARYLGVLPRSLLDAGGEVVLEEDGHQVA